MPTTLTVYRGEKSAWWPEPSIRLISGMTLYQPWPVNTPLSLWNKLKQEVSRQVGFTVDKKVAAYAQFLRSSGQPYALSTAWTETGSFTSDFNYVIEIPNVHIFYWGGTKDNLELGEQVNISSPSQVTKDFIVLNASTLAASTILGFGHNTGTKEITFFHDMPIKFISSCNNKTPAELEIKKVQDLSFEEKIKYSKFIRR
ncbi:MULTISPECIES: hypothetical protein [Shewanella]|uniref:hypothetical protein n=1 Tax=Shewanella TaxID=22 RepID=UPI000DE93649|nr:MULTISPECIES: hypothetical protein [Shewanella]RBP78758.1 hypothetical protein DET47_10827 [Shewanella putrefaciens]MCS6123644.1 hypothetical protein [Shewanella baltica]MCS6210083.1 hypothetical protein [Shewanella baltica]MCU8058753.1 hypothetical protein [Shewanella sp. SM35]MCU8067684.1 hypothetical protein [Shewanella sp. SM34]